MDSDPKRKRDKFTVELNPEDRTMLERVKECLNIASDSQAIKCIAWAGANAMHGLFPEPYLKWLFKKERRKLSDERSF